MAAAFDLSGRGFLERTAGSIRETVASLLSEISPDTASILDKPLFHEVDALDLILSAALLLVSWIVVGVFVGFVGKRLLKGDPESGEPHSVRRLVLEALRKPLCLALWVSALYLSFTPVLIDLPSEPLHPLRYLFEKGFDLGVFAALVWFFFRCIRALEVRLRTFSRGTRTRVDDFLIPILIKSLQVIIPLMGVVLALPLLELPSEYDSMVRKVVTLLTIGTVAWILVQAILVVERVITERYRLDVADNLRARSVHTQVYVLKRTAFVIIGIFSVACVLMTFDEVRRVGASILASAGLAGVIIGFAAQRTLANLFAGIQIAFTQPIRLDDVVIVENEWGRIEEITLTYVVVKIWDLRRLVLPISYFIERPFQNWTRSSSDILGAVMLYVDYSLPLDAVRAEAKRIVENAKEWDRKFWNLQVTDATDRTMQIRILATAADASLAFGLRCEIREKLIHFIQRHYPESLPRMRAEIGDRRGLDDGDSSNVLKGFEDRR